MYQLWYPSSPGYEERNTLCKALADGSESQQKEPLWTGAFEFLKTDAVSVCSPQKCYIDRDGAEKS